MRTILFFDDWFLHSRANLARRLGEPQPVPEATLIDPCADTAWGYPSVLFGPEADLWRCYYQGEVPGKASGTVPLVAESDDGVDWRLPDLSERLPLRDRLCPHQLFGVEHFHEWCGVYDDSEAADNDERYKGFVLSPPGPDGNRCSLVVESRDGMRWDYVEGVRWHPTGADPGQFAFWNPQRASYVVTLRPSLADRRIAVSETTDWKTFTAPELAMQADALDTPCALLYGMPVFPYEGVFVGFLWVYHTDPTVDRHQKFLGGVLEMQKGDDTSRILGKIDCQLVYSMNGWHFQRALREPFIPNAQPGEHGSGCIYPSSMVTVGDALRIYSSTSRGEHAPFRFDPARQQAAIVMHTLRKDGFVCLEPTGGIGELTTKWLLWKGGEPELNVAAPHGEALVQIMDAHGDPLEGYAYGDCVPYSGDSVGVSPRWRDGRRASALAGRVVRLGVRIANGRIYALRGDFEHMTSPEARRLAGT